MGEPEIFTAHQVRDMLCKECEAAGGQSAFARKHTLPQSYVNEVANGKRPINTTITRVLGLETVWRRRA